MVLQYRKTTHCRKTAQQEKPTIAPSITYEVYLEFFFQDLDHS